MTDVTFSRARDSQPSFSRASRSTTAMTPVFSRGRQMTLEQKVGGFFLSTLESFPELFGIEPSRTTQEFRAQAPVSGFLSQAAGAFVPYLGAARLARAAPLTGRFIRGAEALGRGRPLATGALGMGAEAVVVEAGRVAIGGSGLAEAVYEGATGRDAEMRSLGQLGGEAIFNVAGSAALGGAFGAIADRVRRGIRVQDAIPGASSDQPLPLQIRAMNDWIRRAQDPADPLSPDSAFLERVVRDRDNRIRFNLGDIDPNFASDGQAFDGQKYRSRGDVRIYRRLEGERRNRNGDGQTSSFLGRLIQWSTKNIDKATDTRRLIVTPGVLGGFQSEDALAEVVQRIMPGMNPVEARGNLGSFTSDLRVVRVREGSGKPKGNPDLLPKPPAFSINDFRQAAISAFDKPGLVNTVLLEDVQGLVVGDGVVDVISRELATGRLQEAQFQQQYADVIAAIRAKHGNTVTLYRADTPAQFRNPNSRVLRMASRKQAEKFATKDRPLESFEVPVDDILAVPARGGYYEVIVRNKPYTRARAKTTAELQAEQSSQRLLTQPKTYAKRDNLQSRANGLEARFMQRAFKDVGDGWRMAKEVDGLYVMVKKITGEWGTAAPGDQYVFFRTDKPEVFAQKSAATNELFMRSAYLPQPVSKILTGESTFDHATDLVRTYGSELPDVKRTRGRLGVASSVARDLGEQSANIVTPSAPLSYRNPVLARAVRLIKDLESHVETRVDLIMRGTRQLDDKKSLLRNFFDLDPPQTGGLQGFIEKLTKEELDEVKFVLESEIDIDALRAMASSGVLDQSGKPLVSPQVADFFEKMQVISDSFADRAKKLDGSLNDSSAVTLLGEFQSRKGHYIFTREFPGTKRLFLQSEDGQIVGIASGNSVAEAQIAAGKIIEDQAKRGRAIYQGQLVDETFSDPNIAAQLRRAVVKPGFLKNRGNLMGYDLQHGDLTASKLRGAVEKNLRRRENWLKEVSLREHLAEPKAVLGRQSPNDAMALESIFQRAIGNEGDFARTTNTLMDKATGGLLGKDSASAIVKVTQQLLNSFQMAFGNITQPLLNGIGLFQTVFPEIAYVLHASPQSLARNYVTIPLMDSAGNVTGSMGVLSEFKLMNNAFARIGRSWESQDPEFRKLIEDLISDRSLSPRYAEEQFGANGAILKNPTQAFKDTESFVSLANAANEIMLSKTEELNRLVAVSAAFELGKLRGLSGMQLKVFSREFLAKTAFNYGTVDRAAIFTTPIGSLMGTFKNWMFHYMANMVRYSTEGKGALPALAWQTASTALIGGAAATPLVLPVADAFSKWATGGTAMENIYNAVGPDNEWVADGLIYGLPGSMGISFASQAASPGSNPERDAQMLFSFAAWDRVKALSTATKDALNAARITGESPWEDENVRMEMVRALAPRTMYRAMSVAESTAVRSMSTGYDVTAPMGMGGALMYAAGFNPTELEKTYEVYNLVRNDQRQQRALVAEYGQTLAQAWENGDTRLANRVFARAMATGVDMSSVLRSARARGERQEETQLEFAADGEARARYAWAFD